jgi:hypothetical protein
MEELDKTQKNYHAVLIRLMSFLNEQAYDDDHVFSQDELASLQPADTATIRIKLVGLTILTPYYLPRRLLPCHL